MIMQPSDLVLRFISSIGDPRETRYYLSLFRAERPESFALIAVSGEAIREAAGALLTNMRFLGLLGLTPVMDFCYGFHGQDDVAHAYAWELADELAPAVRAEVTTRERAAEVARSGAIPLVVPAHADPEAPGSTGQGASASVPAGASAGAQELAALAAQVATRKVVLLRRRSGLQCDDGKVPSLVDLTTDYEDLCRRLDPEQAEILGAARELILCEGASHRVTVAVTSPLDLLRELFTVRGAGTLIRRGSLVTRYQGYQELPRERVRALMESAFARPLAPDFFDRPADAVYVADDMRGLAIVADTPHGSYLSKFAVDRRAQGEGVGGDIWRALCANHATLLWRSRPDNPIVPWYQERCDGMHRAGRWQVFWRGLAAGALPAAIEYALSAPPDFPDPSGAASSSTMD